jgi:fluoroquinolone transport system ATP-binding protein
MIEVEELTFTYPGAEAPTVRGVSFEVGPGEIVGLLGPSGAGKSTIQKVLIKLLPMQQGSVRYEGAGIGELDRSFFNRVGVSFEHPNVFPKLTAAENLSYFAGLYDREVMSPREALELVGLGADADKPAGDYSKGMKQRLVLARALQHRPDILFLDEPTSGLDPATAQKVMDLIAAQRDRGAAILLTTHNMHAADTLCDRLAFLHAGEIAALDSPRALKLAHGERAVEVEHRVNGALERARFDLGDASARGALTELLAGADVETVHTREATLDQIFIKLTGAELAA